MENDQTISIKQDGTTVNRAKLNAIDESKFICCLNSSTESDQ